MHADVPNHEPSLMLMNCGEARLIRPSIGSWVTYGLGTENQNLPGFIAMCPGGYPIQETQNWQAALPARRLPGHLHRHAAHRDRQADREHPQPLRRRARAAAAARPARSSSTSGTSAAPADDAAAGGPHPVVRAGLPHADRGRATPSTSAASRSTIRDMYGPGVQARQLLIARRLLERGVRFVQVWHGDGQPWDNHDDLEVNHRQLAQAVRPGRSRALLKDLKQRGLLDETLVIWGGEFGRTPTVELPTPGANAGKINGRDHNHYGFTMWLAGGGVKGGHVHGATDEFGFQAVENKVHVHDLHATILHLLGFDHEKLTYRYAGRDFRLTDVHGKVVQELIA